MFWLIENGTLYVEMSGNLHPFLSEADKAEIQKIVIAEGCTRIAESVFAYCENLIEVILPKSLKIIAKYVFRSCRKLIKVALPEDLIGLGSGVFQGCTSLEQLELPPKLRLLPRNAFRDCTGFKRIRLPDALFEIGRNALPNSKVELLYRGNTVRVENGAILREDTGEIVRFLAENHGRKLAFSDEMLTVRSNGTFDGAKIAAYACGIDWNGQIPIPATQLELNVRSPFCCNVGDAFWAVYNTSFTVYEGCFTQNFNIVYARLLSVLTADDYRATIRIEIIKIIDPTAFVKPVSAEQKEYLYHHNEYCYTEYRGYQFYGAPNVDANTIKIVYGIDDIFQFSDYIFTDSDGIDHWIATMYLNDLCTYTFVGDKVLGLHADSIIRWQNGLLIDCGQKQ